MASEKITALIEEVKNLSVLELSELVKALEEEFGVSAAAMAAPAAGAGAAAEAAEEKTGSMSFWKASTPQQRSRSSRLSAKSLVWAWLTPRQPWKALPPL